MDYRTKNRLGWCVLVLLIIITAVVAVSARASMLMPSGGMLQSEAPLSAENVVAERPADAASSGVSAPMRLAVKLPPASPVAAGDYTLKVQRRILPNIVWAGKTPSRETVIWVQCLSDGHLQSVAIVRSSGDVEWDASALRAVSVSNPMPVDANGQAPAQFTIRLRPGI
jgi:TonB family protein